MSKIHIDPACYSTTIYDSEVILNTKSGKYHELNETGSLIWNFIKDGENRTAIINELTKNYEINETKATSELDKFIKSSLKRGLIFISE